MRTITHYQADIAELMAKVNAVRTKCTAENRDPVPEEVSYMNDLMKDIEEIDKLVATLERQERIHARLESPASAPVTVPRNTDPKPVDRPQDKFASFGEQLAAVRLAGLPSGRVDPRLLKAAASGVGETVPSDGGFLVQTDFTGQLIEDLFATGILAARCQRIQVSGNANSTKAYGIDETSRASTRYGGIIGYWEGEGDQFTGKKPKFREIDLKLKKLTGLCYATDESLEDAAQLGGIIQRGFVGEFGFLLDDALVNGDGSGKPLGILNSGCLVTVDKENGQQAATILAENIDKMYSRRFASQTSNYVWLYNQMLEPQFAQMAYSVGTGGIPAYLPPGGMADTPYGRIKGLPAFAIEQCAALGTKGDIILANFPNGYVLAEKGGIKSDVSIHVRFEYGESVFRFIMRIDGQPVRASALTPYKGGAGATQSHFITLAARA